MQEQIELCLKKISELERKLERYYQLLKVDNELDFIIKGTYLLDEDLEPIITGMY